MSIICFLIAICNYFFKGRSVSSEKSPKLCSASSLGRFSSSFISFYKYFAPKGAEGPQLFVYGLYANILWDSYVTTFLKSNCFVFNRYFSNPNSSSFAQCSFHEA